MKKNCFILFLFSVLLSQMQAQSPTIGLLEIDQDLVSDGYTLYCPWISSEYYLIDNCGEKVNTWKTDLSFDLKMAYLDEEGNFIILNQDEVRKYDWDSNLIWSLSSQDYGIEGHHDFEIMPDGNILLIARESVTFEEGISLGFDSTQITSNLLAIDGLYEFKHIENDSFQLVWRWNFKDHLVQNVDETLDNYGDIDETPRRLNLNTLFGYNVTDWVHCNGVNYNESLDQIILSSRHTSEIYIIDHSTTIDEAASSSGGVQGHGGDFLWRWGSPNLRQQHDPNWIPDSHPNGGMISVFNNIDGSGLQDYSTIKIIDPGVDAQGKYLLDENNQFLPQEATKVISGKDHQIFSPFMSGAHSLANGNFIICSGRFGDFYELTEDEQLVWKYHNPIFEVPQIQFSEPIASFTFNIQKYPKDFIGFEGKDLTPKGLVENLNPLSEACSLSTNTEDPFSLDLTIFPNPSSGVVNYTSDIPVEQVQIFALSGKRIAVIDKPSHIIDYLLPNGSYIFQFRIENQLVNKLVSILP